MAVESLEPRALLAVTASLTGGDLVIAYNDAGDVLADIVSDGTKYTVSGTGLAGKQFKIADVTGVITVADKASKSGQTFQVLSGNSLAAPLQVNANVETTSLLGGINASLSGDVLIGSATISLANDISTATTNGNISLTGAVTLAANVALNAGSGAISFNGTVDGAQTLGLTAGTGNVTFTGVVGNTTPLGAITINSAKDVTANGIRAASLTQVAGSGTTTLNGGAFTSAPAVTEAVRTTAVAGVSLTGTSLAVNAAINTANGGTVGFGESNTITIAAAGDISADGAVSMKAANGITTAGDVTTTDDPVTYASAVTLSGPVAVSTGSGAGNILFSSTLDGAKQVTLAAGTGAVAFKGAVGGTTPLAGITLSTAGSTTADSSIKLVKTADSGQDGLTVAASVNNVKMTAAGSSITGFSGNGITFLGGSTNSQLTGFTVAGNKGNGIVFEKGSYAGTTLKANTITGNGDLANKSGSGIVVKGSGLTIGGDASPATAAAVRNQIFGNGQNGVELSTADAQGVSVLSNSIYLNGALAANNRSVVGKGIAYSAGATGSQSPVIYHVTHDNAAGKIRVQYRVNAAGTYRVQFFTNTAADERAVFPADTSGFEGRTYVAQASGVAGNQVQTIEFDDTVAQAGNWLTATATLTETKTSPFSAGVQLAAAPPLAVGGDAPATWSAEYAYQRINANQVRLTVPNGQSSQVLRALRAAEIVFAPRGGGPDSNVVRTAAGGRTLACNSLILNLKPGAALPAGSGTLVAGPVGLPAARLYDASNSTVLLDIGPTQIAAALQGAGATAAQANAFATRFQGGMRVTAGDLDGDGYADLVTAPGAIPTSPSAVAKNLAPLVAQLGNTPRVITIYNGNATGTWQSASVDVSGVFGAGYTGGFLVTLGDVRFDTPGSGSAVAELIVAATNTVAVFEVSVASRSAQPSIVATPTAIWSAQQGRHVTGLAAGDFSDAATDEVVVATSTTTGSVMPARGDVGKTTAFVQTFAAGGASFVPGTAFAISSLVQSGPAPGGYPFNVFFNGAGLAVGDINGAEDVKPELVLAASANGLANFRVLPSAVVAAGSQADVDTALSGIGYFTKASRAASTLVNGNTVWQPTGGPDYFTGMSSVPNANALGANAPLSVAVVNSRGTSLRADIFAALGATNATNNAIRRISWDGSAWLGAATLAGPGTITVEPSVGSPKTRLPFGNGLRLG